VCGSAAACGYTVVFALSLVFLPFCLFYWPRRIQIGATDSVTGAHAMRNYSILQIASRLFLRAQAAVPHSNSARFWHTKFFITPRVLVDESEMRRAVERRMRLRAPRRVHAGHLSPLMPLGAAQEKLWLFYGPKKVEWRVQARNCI
jgi:hypothetical protein